MIYLPNTNAYQEFVVGLKEAYPFVKIRLRSKFWLTRWLDKTLLRASKYSYITTIGPNIYVPDDWQSGSDNEKFIVLYHEVEHIRQYMQWGLENIWFGTIMVGILYLLILPMVFTMRSYFEKQAMEQTAIAMQIVGYNSEAHKNGFIQFCIDMFTSIEYLYMCPFPKHIEEWAEKTWDNAQNTIGVTTI